MNYARSLTEGSVGKLLIRFSFPILLASAIQTAYGSVDVLFLGWFASPAALAGAGNSAALIYSVTGLFLGLMSGGTILLGQYFGSKQDNDAARATGNIAVLLVGASILATGLLLAFGKNLLRLVDVPAEALPEAWAYMRICASGLIFTMGYSAVSSILRALGNSRAPLYFVAVSCCVNIALDYLFVGVLKMNAAGAAYATVIAQTVSLFLALLYILRAKLPYKFGFMDFRPDLRTLARIISLGVPISLQTLLNTISFIVIAAIINGMGVSASAANGVVNNIVNFYMIIPMALGSALSAFSAQNIGAGKPERAYLAVKRGVMASLIIAIPATLLASLYPREIVSLIAKDADVIRESALFLIPFSWDFLFVSFVFCINGFYNGCGVTRFVAIHEMAAAFLVRIPLSWVFSRLAGATLFHVGVGTPAATAASLAMCIVYYKLRLPSVIGNLKKE